MSITKEDFHLALQTVVDSSCNLYDSAYLFHFDWEDDDTYASHDEKRFVELVELMNFPAPKLYAILRVLQFNKMPAFELQVKIAYFLAKVAHNPGDLVVILHYVGHGRKNLNGELELCGLSGKVIALERLLNNIQTNQIIALEECVDIVVALDCCFAFLASRTNQPNHRRIDVLCANEEHCHLHIHASVLFH